MPDSAITLPESTKNGIASSRNFAMPENRFVGITDILSPQQENEKRTEENKVYHACSASSPICFLAGSSFIA